MAKLKGKKIQIIQGGGALPFAKPVVDDPCPPGEHVERIYFPDVPKDEEAPLRRLAKMKEAVGQDPFEIAAVEHNIRKGHITHGRQISRNATQAEKDAGLPGNHQHIKAVCVKCGQFREIDHASNRKSLVEAKNQDEAYGGTDQFKNNATMVERGSKVSYKLPEYKKKDKKRNETLEKAGFDVVFVNFS